MLINRANLDALFTGYNAAFRSGLQATTETYWKSVAMEVPSTTGTNLYTYLDQLPGIREWVGERQLKSVAALKYSIANRDFEETIAVERNTVEDDSYGIYTPIFEGLGQDIGRFRDQLVFPLLNLGFTTLGPDGQYFFDTDHPTLDINGNLQGNGSNSQGGGGAPWFLVDDSRPVKPMIIQKRREFGLVRKDQPTDDNSFFQKMFLYGVDGRFAAGWGFWQTVYGSMQPLNYDNYNLAAAAMGSLKGNYGKPLGLKPRKLVYPPSLRTLARETIKRERLADGSSNINQDVVELVEVPFLA